MVERQTTELQNAQRRIMNQKKLGVLEHLSDGRARDLLVSLNSIKDSIHSLDELFDEQNPKISKILDTLKRETV